MNREVLEEKLAELPLYAYFFVDPKALEFSERVRWICENECGRYGKSWACPPGVGTLEECRARCLSFENCLVIATITEVADIADIEETLATRGDHEQITDETADILRPVPPVRHSGRAALPPPGENAPLRGEPGDQCGARAGGKRAGVPVRMQCGDLDLHAVLLKGQYAGIRSSVCTKSFFFSGSHQNNCSICKKFLQSPFQHGILCER